MTQRIDIKGQKFGKLEVKCIGKPDSLGRTKWSCKCDCGKIVDRNSHSLRSGRCTSCGCDYYPVGSKSRRWKGHKEIGSKFWSSIIRAARQRDIEFDITVDYAWGLYLKQDRKCFLTGRNIGFDENVTRYDNSASLDRIDNTRGYVEGNVQWVHKDVNRMKWILTNDEFISICKETISYEKQKNFVT